MGVLKSLLSEALSEGLDPTDAGLQIWINQLENIPDHIRNDLENITPNDVVKFVFNTLDMDGNGSVAPTEFIILAANMSLQEYKTWGDRCRSDAKISGSRHQP